MNADSDTALLVARQVTVQRQQHRVVTDFSERLEPGQLVGLLGANGAGKTTLLKALAGLLPVSAGQVMLCNRGLADWPLRERARVLAYMSQSRECPWPLAVEELVLLGRLPHRGGWSGVSAEDRKAVASALRACEIDQLSERIATTLSGGELARVLLARALATEAYVLLLDEPGAGLDPAHQLHLMTLGRNLAAQGKAVLMVMHDLSLAARFCDRCWLLHDHMLLASGSPHAVLNDANLATAFQVRGAHDPRIGVVPVERLQ